LHPLKPGSAKETAFINYVDAKLLHVTRRFAKKDPYRNVRGALKPPPVEVSTKGEGIAESNGDTTDQVLGYYAFPEVAADLSNILDVIYVSGTPSLQTPYLMNVALLAVSYMPAFTWAPKETLSLLRKLDIVFVGVLESGEGKGVTMTEKVRLRALVERTRLVVIEVAGGERFGGDDVSVNEGGGEEETDDELDGPVGTASVTEGEGDEMSVDIDTEDGLGGDEELERWDLDISNVYAGTIRVLDETMGPWDAG
jgi:hypothetical protein